MPDAEQRRKADFEYDVCLSFAGEDRVYVREVADRLVSKGIRVFYDEYEELNLWGKDLFQHLDYIYQESARFCVVFISSSYERKLWTNHEIKSAQARAFSSRGEFLLPARFDETEIPGIRRTTGYLDLRNRQPSECADLIVQKLEPYKLFEFQDRRRFFPPDPDLLYKSLGAKTKKSKRHARLAAYDFFRALDRLTDAERRVVLQVFVSSCPHDFPRNVHIDMDLLRRIVGYSSARIKQLLSNINSLGFYVSYRSADGIEKSDGRYVYIFWVCRREELIGEGVSYSNAVALSVVNLLTLHYCEDHALFALMNRNFSALSSVTAVEDVH